MCSGDHWQPPELPAWGVKGKTDLRGISLQWVFHFPARLPCAWWPVLTQHRWYWNTCKGSAGSEPPLWPCRDGAQVIFRPPVSQEFFGQNITYLFRRMMFAATKQAEISVSAPRWLGRGGFIQCRLAYLLQQFNSAVIINFSQTSMRWNI